MFNESVYMFNKHDINSGSYCDTYVLKNLGHSSSQDFISSLDIQFFLNIEWSDWDFNLLNHQALNESIRAVTSNISF